LSLNPQSPDGGRRVFGIDGATNVANATKAFRSLQSFRLFGRFGATSGANGTKEFTTLVTASTAPRPQHDSFRSMTTVPQRATGPTQTRGEPILVRIDAGESAPAIGAAHHYQWPGRRSSGM
jgi:hypothetical protein